MLHASSAISQDSWPATADDVRGTSLDLLFCSPNVDLADSVKSVIAPRTSTEKNPSEGAVRLWTCIKNPRYNRGPQDPRTSTMSLPERSNWLGAILAFFLVSLAHGVQENTIYAFGAPGSGDGMYPYCNVVFDAKGNLYGTTRNGGSYGAGIIFELSPGENGQWFETVLYEFTGSSDGGNPFAGLVFDSAGNLYGAGAYGGTNGTGVVFELSPQGGEWVYNVLYNFGAYPLSGDGFAPNSVLVFDKLGNLYGTTYGGGNDAECFGGCGTVFELSPISGGGWKEQVIHSFEANGTDGELPAGGVTLARGRLFGTTQNGGVSGSGILYELEYSSSSDAWIETIVHQFVGGTTDGSFPEASVLVRAGALYGTTQGGGLNGHGTVFETTPTKNKGWVTTVLYSFGQSYSGDGFGPQAGLTSDPKGNFYGTTSYGGAYNYYGTVFRLSKTTDGTWKESTLYSFDGSSGPPDAPVTIHDGSLYGTAPTSGNDSGIVYQVGP